MNDDNSNNDTPNAPQVPPEGPEPWDFPTRRRLEAEAAAAAATAQAPPSLKLPPDPRAAAAAATVPEPDLSGPLDLRKLFDALLRAPAALVKRLAEPSPGTLAAFAGIAVAAVLAYGLVLGSFAMGVQLWAAPLKILAGLGISALICFPSLYIFFCLSGSQATVSQLATVFGGALALGGLLLLGFAPAVWIFTQATNGFGFMGLLALLPWFVALHFGFRFLFMAASATGSRRLGPVRIWSVIFLLVTLQMSTSLRPILGRSDKFLTNEKRFFLEHWMESSGMELKSGEAEKKTAADITQPAPGSEVR